MSIILQTRDDKICVVPRSYLSYWEVFSSVEEAVGNNSDDIVAIPLTSEQVDIWLDLTIRMQVEWLFIQQKDEEYLPPLYKRDVEVIARCMDAKDTEWYLYCIIEENETDEELKRWYEQVGILCARIDREFNWNVGAWYNDLNDELIADYCIFDDNYKEDGSVGIFGILHNDLLKKMGSVNSFCWQDVDWNMIVRLGLSNVIPKIRGGISKHTTEIAPNILLLCYDGIHTPPVPNPTCFTRRVPDLIDQFELFEQGYTDEIADMYCRIMRAAIATMKHYPNDIFDIAESLSLVSTDSGDENDIDSHRQAVLRMHGDYSTNSIDIAMLLKRVGEEGIRLFKEAKLLYLESEMKKYKSI